MVFSLTSLEGIGSPCGIHIGRLGREYPFPWSHGSFAAAAAATSATSAKQQQPTAAAAAAATAQLPRTQSKSWRRFRCWRSCWRYGEVHQSEHKINQKNNSLWTFQSVIKCTSPTLVQCNVNWLREIRDTANSTVQVKKKRKKRNERGMRKEKGAFPHTLINRCFGFPKNSMRRKCVRKVANRFAYTVSNK